MLKLTETQIEEIADFLDSGLICLFNTKTNEIITITEFDDLYEPDELAWDNIIEFERMNSHDSFELMVDFVEQLENCFLKEKLINILNRPKPFKNFKIQIDNSGEYRQKWFDFKNIKYIDYVKSQIEAINENKESELDFEDQVDFEGWEAVAEFYEKEDWVGLLKLQKRRAEKDPTNLQLQEALAIALNLNKKYAETLKLLEPFYRQNHKSGFGINEIMKALIGLNKTENDFNWVKKPKILKLDDETINLCVEYLKRKRKPRSVSDVYIYLIVKSDFMYFNEESLAEYLSNFPNLFNLINESSDLLNLQLTLKRKKGSNGV